MGNETCRFCGFKRSKCLKGCFYLWITLIKKTTRAHIKQWPWPKVISIYVIMTFIYVSLYFVYILFDTTEVNQNVHDSPNTGIFVILYVTCLFCGFKRSKCLKGSFYLWINLIKKTTRVHMRCTMIVAI
jgi:hypothetical protein